MPSTFSRSRADTLAAELELSLDRVCLACLSFVSFPLADGQTAEAERWVRRMTPDLWRDGLDEQAFTAVRRAAGRGVRDAAAALTDLEGLGPRSGVARAIVRRLAHDLADRERIALRVEQVARPRLVRAPPELN